MILLPPTIPSNSIRGIISCRKWFTFNDETNVSCNFDETFTGKLRGSDLFIRIVPPQFLLNDWNASFRRLIPRQAKKTRTRSSSTIDSKVSLRVGGSRLASTAMLRKSEHCFGQADSKIYQNICRLVEFDYEFRERIAVGKQPDSNGQRSSSGHLKNKYIQLLLSSSQRIPLLTDQSFSDRGETPILIRIIESSFAFTNRRKQERNVV